MTGPKPRPMPTRPETLRRRARSREQAASAMTVFVRGLDVLASIGVHPHEHETKQRVLVDIEIDLGATPPPADDRLGETLDYQAVAEAVEEMCREGHVQLVETLAARIAAWCLRDDRVTAAKVRVEKPAALADAAGAGCEVVRRRT